MDKIGLALLCLLAATASAHSQPASGTYGPLHIVATKDSVAGVYDMRIGEGATEIVCAFLLEGQLVEEKIAVDIWLPGLPETTRGMLNVATPDKIIIQTDDAMPGCAMASGELARDGEEVSLDAARPDWRAVGVVMIDEVQLRNGSTSRPNPQGHILAGFDAVAVLELDKDQAHVELFGGTTNNAGWVPRSSIAVAPLSAQ